MGAGKEKSAIKCVAFLIEQILTHKKRKKLKRDRIKVTERGGNTGKEREREREESLQESATGATLSVITNED